MLEKGILLMPSPNQNTITRRQRSAIWHHISESFIVHNFFNYFVAHSKFLIMYSPNNLENSNSQNYFSL